jgi:uncharacterized protein (TIGR00661 family)
MKILYGIQGTGNGHVARAREILPALNNHAHVDVILSGNQSQLDLGFKVNYQSEGLTFKSSKKGGIAYLKSIFTSSPIDLIRDIRQLPVKKYDLVISDFEPVSSWSALINGVPCIDMSHQAAVSHALAPKPTTNDRIGSYVLSHYSPAMKKYGFHFESFAKDIFTPVIRKDVRILNPQNKGYYTVYLPFYADEYLVRFLQQFDANWHVFSKSVKGITQLKNVQIQPIENGAFLKSLESCAGVLCGAGFELPSEALFLGKKLMVIPMQGQYEQQCNAAALQAIGIDVLDSLDLIHHRTINYWISKPMQKNMINYPDQTELIIQHVINEFKTHQIPTEISAPSRMELLRYFI